MITKIDRMNGYLGYTRIKGKTRYNESKNAEIIADIPTKYQKNDFLDFCGCDLTEQY